MRSTHDYIKYLNEVIADLEKALGKAPRTEQTTLRPKLYEILAKRAEHLRWVKIQEAS